MSAELAAELDKNQTATPLRFHVLKQMARSPAHARHAAQFDSEPTLAKRMGSAVHSLLLGGAPVSVFTGKVKRGKEWDAFVAANQGAIHVNQKEYDRARRIADKVKSNEIAARVLFGEGYVYEEPIFWSLNGRAMRCTPDVRSWRHLVDLKTCRNAEPEKFMWDAVRMGYHAQLALYAKAMSAVSPTGSGPRDVYIVSVESYPPFDVVVRRVTPQSLDIGGRLVDEWMTKFLACEAANHWPGQAEAVVDLDVPLEQVDLVWGDDDEADEES